MMRRTDDPPSIEECRELLEPHRKRKIRRLAATGDELERAIFDVVYHETPATTHAVARAVERELVLTERTVGELLDGWRPAALR